METTQLQTVDERTLNTYRIATIFFVGHHYLDNSNVVHNDFNTFKTVLKEKAEIYINELDPINYKDCLLAFDELVERSKTEMSYEQILNAILAVFKTKVTEMRNKIPKSIKDVFCKVCQEITLMYPNASKEEVEYASIRQFELSPFPDMREAANMLESNKSFSDFIDYLGEFQKILPRHAKEHKRFAEQFSLFLKNNVKVTIKD